jgi:hypothetical protein
VLRELSNGQTELWRKPLIIALEETPAWFAPLALLVPTVMAAFRASPLMKGITLSLITSSAFFWGGDLLGRAYVLSMPFYYSFLLPVSTLSGATLCGEMLVSEVKSSNRKLLFILFAMAVSIPTIWARFGHVSWRSEAFIFIILVIPLIFVLSSFQNRLLITISLTGVLTASLVVSSTAMFSWIAGHYQSNDIAVLELAADLENELPKAATDGRVMRFWYNDEKSTESMDTEMIGACWLHPFCKLLGKDGHYVPFLKMESADASAISESGTEIIVIMDKSPDQVARASKVIEEAGIPFHIVKTETLISRNDSAHRLSLAIVERNKTSPSNSIPIDLRNMKILHQGSFATTNNGIRITSPSIKGWDFVKIPVGTLQKGEAVAIRFKMRKGLMEFSINDKSNPHLDAVEKWPYNNDDQIFLVAPFYLSDAWVSLASMYPTGSVSSVTIENVEKVNPVEQSLGK